MLLLDGRVLTLTSDDLPDKEQSSKRGFVSEDVDIGGLVKRNRVVDQTIFDAMFLMEMIDQGHHEAVHLFLGSTISSGMSLSGISPDTVSRPPAYAVGDAMADRRMAFSAPYRRVVAECGDEAATRLVDIFSDIYTYPRSKGALMGLANSLLPALSALVDFYGIASRRDPRKIVRRQVGYYKKKKAPLRGL
jgi:hypothetical protein